MKKWYRVSIIGWIFALSYAALSAFIVHGRVVLDEGSSALQLYNYALVLQVVMLVLFLYAYVKQVKLFASKK